MCPTDQPTPAAPDTAAPEVIAFYSAETYRLEDSMGYMVKQLAHSVSRELDRRMSGLDLTDAQWKPMLMLRQGVAMTAADLARCSYVDTGAITRVLDRLEAKQLIRRERSDADRRIVNLVLTDAGHRVADEVPRIIAELANQVLAGFSEPEFHQFRHLLGRALENARRLEEGNPA